MIISMETLHSMVPHATNGAIIRFYTPLCETMERFAINNRLRISAFIAQVAHESGSFRYLEEIASGKAYEGRKDLGNNHPVAFLAANKHGTTPGRFYKGRGLLQLTGFYNYEKYGELMDLDLINEPGLLLLPKYACLSAGYFWNEHNLNKWADLDDIRKITRIINGGTNGLTQRKLYFETNKRILSSYFQ